MPAGRRRRERRWRPAAGETSAEETALLLALSALPEMGPARLDAVLASGGPAGAWQAVRSYRPAMPGLPSGDVLRGDPARLFARWRRAAHELDPPALLARHRDAGVQVLPYGSADYPARLLDDPEPPLVLFAKGSPQACAGRAVAVVGTRRCSPYGATLAREWCSALAAAGAVVVSGLARGIDALAHVGALTAGGAPPVGVVGTGLDVVYPRSSRALWQEVPVRGALLSEAPLGARPEPWRFPARNRIIAGLADAVLVVESDEVGGSMLTVGEALERGRPVLAVPGSVRAPTSRGCNVLLRDGAHPALEPADVLAALGFTGGGPDGSGEPGGASRDVDVAQRDVDPDLRAVLEFVGWEPMSVERLAAGLGWPLTRTFAATEELLADGVLVQRGGVVQRQ